MKIEDICAVVCNTDHSRCISLSDRTDNLFLWSAAVVTRFDLRKGECLGSLRWQTLAAVFVIFALLLIGVAGSGGLPSVLFSQGRAGAAEAEASIPHFKLPWQDGQPWRSGVAGFHGSNDALDFLPPDSPLGLAVTCEGDPGWVPLESQYFVLAAAPGVVTKASDSMVLVDHGNGWSSGYFHLGDFLVQPGDVIPPKSALARPSSYGDCNTGPQVHFWINGPNGQTLRSIAVSSRDPNAIGPNEVISVTNNWPSAAPQPVTPPTPTATPTARPIALKGDVDCSLTIDAKDALKVLRYVAGLGVDQEGLCPAIGSSTDSVNGDANCDQEVNVLDALLILRYIADLPVALSPGCSALGPVERQS